MDEIIEIAKNVLGLITASVAVIALIWKGFRWFDRPRERDKTISELEARVRALEERHDGDVREIQTEQTLVIYGLLACLKGLQAQGCNGAVPEAISRIEKHLNQKAHEQ